MCDVYELMQTVVMIVGVIILGLCLRRSEAESDALRAERDGLAKRCNRLLADNRFAVRLFVAGMLRLAQARKATRTLLNELYPAEVFAGCEECSAGTCDCDRGVQLVRAVRDALGASTAERIMDDVENEEKLED